MILIYDMVLKFEQQIILVYSIARSDNLEEIKSSEVDSGCYFEFFL